jgi:hypothetical protein
MSARHTSLVYCAILSNMLAPSWVWWAPGQIPDKIHFNLLFYLKHDPDTHMSSLISHMGRMRWETAVHHPSWLDTTTPPKGFIQISPPLPIFCHFFQTVPHSKVLHTGPVRNLAIHFKGLRRTLMKICVIEEAFFLNE